jgi:cytochrome c oxidase cbb3-type subunit 3/ubiquinol-cytochrome c reductase cytochrome c subunit
MSAERMFAGMLALALPLLSGCDMPGRPQPGPEVPRPETVTSFDTLYGENCAGCHGKNGDNGSAANLSNPLYQALIDDASLRDVIANGEKGTLMPGFSVKSGGPLTDAQIDAIVQGMRARWRKENAAGGDAMPPYKAAHPGDVTKGQAVYAAACARCHGDLHNPGTAGSILDGSFLDLINEQTVRTTIIAGRPDIGEPDWRNHISGRAMTDDEITDVSAWLIAQRPATPGQPYPNAKPVAQLPGQTQPLGTEGRPSKPAKR